MESSSLLCASSSFQWKPAPRPTILLAPVPCIRRDAGELQLHRRRTRSCGLPRPCQQAPSPATSQRAPRRRDKEAMATPRELRATLACPRRSAVVRLVSVAKRCRRRPRKSSRAAASSASWQSRFSASSRPAHVHRVPLAPFNRVGHATPSQTTSKPSRVKSSETASECEDSFDYVGSSSSWIRSSSKRNLKQDDHFPQYHYYHCHARCLVSIACLATYHLYV